MNESPNVSWNRLVNIPVPQMTNETLEVIQLVPEEQIREHISWRNRCSCGTGEGGKRQKRPKSSQETGAESHSGGDHECSHASDLRGSR